jgi:proteasome lid subunit RPN8/RPN11
MELLVRVRRSVLDEMLAHARADAAVECCGLLGGRDGEIVACLPAGNVLASATAYEIAPAELFALVRRLRAGSLELAGIYHSHPRGENAPSPRDLERAYYPDAAWFILSPRDDAPAPVRAFRIRDGRAAELRIVPT